MKKYCKMILIIVFFFTYLIFTLSCIINPYKRDTLYLINVIEENYPFLSIDDNKNGYNWKKYVNRIILQTDFNSINDAKFIKLIKELLYPLNEHVNLISTDYIYSKYKKIYCFENISQNKNLIKRYKPWNDVLNSSVVQKMYNYKNIDLYQKKQIAKSYLKTYIRNNKLVIEIPTFSPLITELELEQIENFLKINSSKERDIVIDIRKIQVDQQIMEMVL